MVLFSLLKKISFRFNYRFSLKFYIRIHVCTVQLHFIPHIFYKNYQKNCKPDEISINRNPVIDKHSQADVVAIIWNASIDVSFVEKILVLPFFIWIFLFIFEKSNFYLRLIKKDYWNHACQFSFLITAENLLPPAKKQTNSFFCLAEIHSLPKVTVLYANIYLVSFPDNFSKIISVNVLEKSFWNLE